LFKEKEIVRKKEARTLEFDFTDGVSVLRRMSKKKNMRAYLELAVGDGGLGPGGVFDSPGEVLVGQGPLGGEHKAGQREADGAGTQQQLGKCHSKHSKNNTPDERGSY